MFFSPPNGKEWSIYGRHISAYLRKKIQRNGFLGQISHLKKHRLDGEWTIFFSWMDRIVANRLLLYNTGSVLHFNAMIPQQNTSHPPTIYNTTPTLPPPHLPSPGARWQRAATYFLGRAGMQKLFFLELTKSKTTLAHAQSMGSKASWGNIGWVELCLPDPTSPQGRHTNNAAQKMFSILGWHVITLFLCFVKVLRLATGFSHGSAGQSDQQRNDKILWTYIGNQGLTSACESDSRNWEIAMK